MNALVRTELLKLRTARSTLVLLVAAATIALLQVARLVRSAGAPGGVHAGTQDAWAQLLSGAMVGTLLVPLVGVLAVTSELRHGTLTPSLLVTPRRRRVMVAKMVACALTGVAVALGVETCAAAVGLASGTLSGAPARSVLLAVAGGVVLSAFWGWMGVGVGLLVRHQVPALAIPLLWLLVAETLVASYGLDALKRWLPGGAAAGLTGAEVPGVLPAWLAGAVLTAYALALAFPGVRRLGRADIT
jgi:ABC-2 type transport system permease protein